MWKFHVSWLLTALKQSTYLFSKPVSRVLRRWQTEVTLGTPRNETLPMESSSDELCCNTIETVAAPQFRRRYENSAPHERNVKDRKHPNVGYSRKKSSSSVGKTYDQAHLRELGFTIEFTKLASVVTQWNNEHNFCWQGRPIIVRRDVCGRNLNDCLLTATTMLKPTEQHRDERRGVGSYVESSLRINTECSWETHVVSAQPNGLAGPPRRIFVNKFRPHYVHLRQHTFTWWRM